MNLVRNSPFLVLTIGDQNEADYFIDSWIVLFISNILVLFASSSKALSIQVKASWF